MTLTKTPKPSCVRMMMMESKDRSFTASLIFPLFPIPNSKVVFFIDDGESMQAALSEKERFFPKNEEVLIL